MGKKRKMVGCESRLDTDAAEPLATLHALSLECGTLQSEKPLNELQDRMASPAATEATSGSRQTGTVQENGRHAE